jgi:hypothetical protein
VATRTTNLPQSSEPIGEVLSLTTLTGAVRSLKISRLWLRHKQ